VDTVPAYVDWRACTATPLSGEKAYYNVRLKLPPPEKEKVKDLNQHKLSSKNVGPNRTRSNKYKSLTYYTEHREQCHVDT
jgi:hypothetical protein